jgi:hypothetical protein
MSFCLQPMILFAYVAVFIMVMDQTLIGSATFHGNAPTKTMSCDKICLDANGAVVSDEEGCTEEEGKELINPLDDSVACLLNFEGFSKWHSFAMIGVALPSLKNLFSENPKQRILTMLKGALVMYLLYVFMDEIPGIIEALVGGGVKGPSADAVGMLAKSMGAVSGAATRLASLGGKVGGSALAPIGRMMNLGRGKKESQDANSGDEDTGKRSEGDGKGGDGEETGKRNETSEKSGEDNTQKSDTKSSE